jgi:hypothetical protein
LVVLLFIALPASRLGTGMSIRGAVSAFTMVVVVVGMGFAKSMGGRLALILAFSIFIERNYAFSYVYLLPSTTLVVLLIMVHSTIDKRSLVLNGPNARIEGWFVGSVLLMAIGMVIAELVNYRWAEYGIEDMMNAHVPLLIGGIAGYMVMRRGSANVFLALVPVLAVIVAVTCWGYALTGQRTLHYLALTNIQDVGRYGGLLRNPNNAAFLCAVGALVALVLTRVAKGGLKMLYIITSVFLVGTIVLLRTRGAFLVLITVGVCVLFRKGVRKWSIVLLVVAVLSYGIFGSFLQVGQREARSLVERLGEANESMMGRMQIMKDSLELVGRYPFGMGHMMKMFTDVEFTVSGLVSHNEYVTFLVQNGIQSVLPAIVVVMLIFGRWLIAMRRRLPYAPSTELNVTVACFLLTFMFEPIITNCTELALMFGAVVGMFSASVIYANGNAPVEPCSEKWQVG